MLPTDNHVHSRWSWDTADSSSMELACVRAVELGLPGVAFTEHVDFTDWGPGDAGSARGHTVGPRPRVQPFDVEGYAADLARCRDTFPQLRILSGIEAGEPHLFSSAVASILDSGDFDWVLGSLHAVEHNGALHFVDDDLFGRLDARDLMRRYFDELLLLVESSSAFGVLAHCDYARRYWPARAGEYREIEFEEAYRAVFRALAASGRALEINTRSPLASVDLVHWWWQSGGEAVSFGSDAHDPYSVGTRFAVAVDVVEAAGFRPGRDRFDLWRR
ncbi:PHP domain-containing protein [Mycobacterium sp. CVI_P3]|uniref:Histidinol-phosphatase n=1 Tax=Mycobacterium pinniadriaticum TaxID=2994102 RepID=A0ABT3S9M0_9MYCO|nr:PHP domain-containing protein [Mycobacterium pinniadriaticum]MCX2929759.1 PHP domain-containing protein [Mycobacterium pinniadriaticum]MCX2936183.1 PHP domain-containing protein [Mycobacterium pinniadriaticum]